MESRGESATRVATVPNALSLLRVLCIPVFCWLVLVPKRDGLAVVVLMVAGISDFLDGYIARRWNQQSRLGVLLDPAADRLTSIAVPVVLGLRDIVPWWLVALLLARDVVVGVAVLALAGRRRVTVPVTYLGKAATFCLLGGLPLVLLGTTEGRVGDAAFVAGWALTIWGAALYWWSAVTYVQQIRVVASAPSVPGHGART